MNIENAQRRTGEELPWQGRWDEPRQPIPTSVPDNTQRNEPLLYGPRGEVLLERRPRPVGFRKR